MVNEERADDAVLENNVVYLSKGDQNWHVTPALFCRVVKWRRIGKKQNCN